MASKIVNQLLSQSLTKSDALSLLEELKEAAVKEAYLEGSKVSETAAVSPKADVYKDFEVARDEIDKIEVLTIVLPYELPAGSLKKIGREVKEINGSGILLDFKIDPKLIGGCALVYKGKMRDYSMKAALEEKSSQIRNNLNNFVAAIH